MEIRFAFIANGSLSVGRMVWPSSAIYRAAALGLFKYVAGQAQEAINFRAWWIVSPGVFSLKASGPFDLLASI